MPLLSLLDCKDINMIFLTTIAVSMTGMGISFYFPSLGLPLVIPCLAVAGASYGLGVGPCTFILMSSLFKSEDRSIGSAWTQTIKALAIFIQVTVHKTIYVCVCYNQTHSLQSDVKLYCRYSHILRT